MLCRLSYEGDREQIARVFNIDTRGGDTLGMYADASNSDIEIFLGREIF